MEPLTQMSGTHSITHCRTKWSRAHPWPPPPPSLDPPDPTFDTQPLQNLPHISLNALSGLSTPATFCVHGFIHQTWLTVLIDNGSTHSFVQPQIAKFLSLPTTDISPPQSYGWQQLYPQMLTTLPFSYRATPLWWTFTFYPSVAQMWY